jgi:pimeloyl-ACP methyl ester carboxylesterase
MSEASSGAGEYLQVGPLSMYCETVGAGPPLLLLHAGMSTIDSSFGALRPLLAAHWTTLAVEQQAHGHTADIDRPLSYQQMVSDTADLLRQKGVRSADVFGWSDGGIVALGLAAQAPELVRKVATIGAGYNAQAESAEFKERMAALKPDNRNTLPFRDAYRHVAPDPEGWPRLIEKEKAMYAAFSGWTAAEMKSLRAPLMVMLGDADIVRLEHAIELFRMVPKGRLAVLPGSDHSAPVAHPEWVCAMLTDFLRAPDR